MGKIKTIGIYLVLIGVVIFLTLPAIADEGEITDPNFHYREGEEAGYWLTIHYYEVTEDYTIDIKEMFSDPDAFPSGYAKWDNTESQRQKLRAQLQVISMSLVKWDFIELYDGILTIKKGYRWDGASTPWNNLNVGDNRTYYIRASCVHDAIYDLMRMGYLKHDRVFLNKDNAWNSSGFRNRLIADILLYMIVKEDGRPAWRAQNVDFEFVRLGGAGKTHDDSKLSDFKYHISELTAWASDGEVKLHFLPADNAQKDPDDYFTENHTYIIYRNTVEIARIQNHSPGEPGYYSQNDNVFYIDDTVENGTKYLYQVINAKDESLTWWKNRHYDYSNMVLVSVPVESGNCLVLDGIDDYVTADLVSNDLISSNSPYLFLSSVFSYEAWVYPEDNEDHPQTGISAIMAFNTPSGGNFNILMYNWDTKKFCYYDPQNGYAYSDVEIVTNKWHHVAVSSSGINTVLYVNGVAQATIMTTDPATKPSRTALFSIGQEWDGSTPSNFFKGKIDEVRVWKVARTQYEIKIGMSLAMRGDEPGLIGLWHFDDLAVDSTENGNNGFFSGYDTGDLQFEPSDAFSVEEMPEGLIVYYPLDGTAIDISGNSNNGIISGSPTPTSNRFGEADKAYYFDGDDDYITFSNAVDFGAPFSTMALWVRAIEGVLMLGFHSELGSYCYYEIDGNGNLRIFWKAISFPEVVIGGSTNLKDGKWHHIAIVRDFNPFQPGLFQFHAYIDGIPEILDEHGPVFETPFDNTYLGQDFGLDDFFNIDRFKGFMDKVQIFDRALAAAEIFDLADSDHDGLPDRWEMDYGLNPSLVDSDDDDIPDGDEDPDGDGLGNLSEYLTGTHPYDPDSDNDGLPDGWEADNDLDPMLGDTDGDGTNDGDEDPDEDGLGNSSEYNKGTDHNNGDTDNDGLTDGDEVNTYFTDPTDYDSDNDGLTDGDEVNTYFTDPNDPDSDDDGLTDWWEIDNSFDPTVEDTDGNGIADGEEDPDEDGLDNLGEYNAGSDINNPDTDYDTLSDGQEVNTCFTDPADKDSDNDGYTDGQEVFHDSDPNDLSTTPESDPNPMTIYVKEVNEGTISGKTWNNAFIDMQTALAVSVSGDEIWVAKGIYYPYSPNFHGDTPSRFVSFQMKNGVSIYGGFAGDETAVEQRDIHINETILSGDLGVIDDNSDNSYHVFYNSGEINLDSTAVLDGFTVTGGNADISDFPIDSGGGMYNYYSSPTVNNCTFIGNEALASGGGMYNGASSPTLNNCVFIGNTASGGGGIYNFVSSPVLNNCTFSGNSASSGGGMYNINGDTAIVDPFTTLNNCIMWGNTALDGAGEIYNEYITPVISYSDIQGSGGSDSWDTGLGTDDGNNMDADPLFIRNPDPDSSDFGNLHLTANSPCINNGDPSVTEGVDIDGESRVFDGVVDMGADEFVDNDDDDLPDSLEDTTCTDPADADSDDDGIPDGIEDMNLNGVFDDGETDPCDTDTDDDGLLDGEEDVNHNGILDDGETSPGNADSDEDGMPDGWEVQNDLDPLFDDADIDEDGDGFSNLKEYQRNTDPNDYTSHPSRSLPWLQLLLDDD